MLSHVLHDRLCIDRAEQETRMLRQDVARASEAALVAADHRQVPAFLRDDRRWREVISGRQIPLTILGDQSVVAGVVVDIRDERVEAHAPE